MRQHFAGPLFEALAAGQFEPQVGQGRREGDPPVEPREHDPQQLAAGLPLAQIERVLQQMRFQVRGKSCSGQIVVPVLAAQQVEVLLEAFMQLPHRQAEVRIGGVRPDEKHRPQVVHEPAFLAADFDVNRHGEEH